MTFKDYFSKQSADYSTFRPRYPDALFAYLASIVSRHHCAWDCATGNGQAARSLKTYFDQVIATDASSDQISHAQSNDGIDYKVALAEDSGIETKSIDLVTVAQALHWFDRSRFYAEVRRVASSDAILAAWCYGLATIDPNVDRVIWRLYEDILGSYWPPERRWIEEKYLTIDFPFESITAPAFEMSEPWNFLQLMGYLGTWSAVKAYERAKGHNPLESIANDLRDAWPELEVARQVTWPIHLRIGRISK